MAIGMILQGAYSLNRSGSHRVEERDGTCKQSEHRAGGEHHVPMFLDFVSTLRWVMLGDYLDRKMKEGWEGG